MRRECFDGSIPKKGDRVELHPGTDLWMRGARYGEVYSIDRTGRAGIVLDKIPRRVFRFNLNRFRVID